MIVKKNPNQRIIRTVKTYEGVVTYVGHPITLIHERAIKGTIIHFYHWDYKFEYRLDIRFHKNTIYFFAIEMMSGQDVEAKAIAEYPRSYSRPIEMNEILKKYWEYIRNITGMLERGEGQPLVKHKSRW